MQNANMTIPNASHSFNAMLEAFFNVQHSEHMKAWRWHLYEHGITVDRYGFLRCSRTGEICNAKALG